MSIWNEVLDRIERKLSNSSFNTWLKNTILLSVDESTSTLMVGAENEFGRDWLESRYTELISEVLFDITNKHFKLHFVVTTEDMPNEQVQYNYKTESKNTMTDRELLELLLQKVTNVEADMDLVKSQLKESVRFINPRVADTELEIKLIKKIITNQ